MKPIRRRHTRRGVLLLVILGLLAMFSLVALTFVIIAGQAKRGALAASRAELFFDSPDALTHQAMLALLRGDRNTFDPIAVHSLLEDIYGHQGFRCQITAAGFVCGNALIEVTLNPIADPWWSVGRVLTVLEGPAQGVSTHIVGYNPNTTRLQLRTFQNLPPGMLVTDIPGAILNQTVLVNGAAFSGLGFGFPPPPSPFPPPSGKPEDLALKPGLETLDHPPWCRHLHESDPGGANEDYDAPDHQNMHLALAVPILGSWPIISNGPVPVPIPSFHRADLVRYWMQRLGVTDWRSLPPDVARAIILRPLPTVHPNFTGSNPSFDPTWDGLYDRQRAWDVDNDGDGIADSIWLDIGLPVHSTSDGRLYKPLVAFLCLDMDGRLNLNAHGSLEQTSAAYANRAAPPAGRLFAGDEGGAGVELARGAGFGPADINLYNLLSPGGYSLYRQLFVGNSLYDGRYGNSTVPGYYLLCWNKHFAYPATWLASNSAACRGYGTPPDIRGTMAVGLDLRGQPIYVNLLDWGTDQFTGNPYQINLGPNIPRGLPRGTPNNNPFSPAELERILRAYDADASLLPQRLAALTSPDGNPWHSVLFNPESTPPLDRRTEVTTESWDVPVAPFAFNPVNPEYASRPRHVAEMLMLKFPTAPVSQLLAGRLLPPEILQGLKMDLNRPWGDGRDTNGNGVIDESEEADQETFPQKNSSGADVTVTAAQTDLTQGTGVSENLARQLYARYLYCLAMTLWDLDYLDARLGNRQTTCRYIAQWAVNVVDSRDRDSIMTCFEYDPNPFSSSGWRCDGNPSTDDGISGPHVVWGCERPEMLLTETIAFHDRRVEDLNTDSSTKYTTDPNEPDDDFDQRLRPRGSLFVELYNPWTDTEPWPAELYRSGPEGMGVDLTLRAPDGTPVWRLVIVSYTELPQGTPQPDPANPYDTTPPTIDRSIYFVNPGGTPYGGEDANTQRYYPSNAGGIVPPGRYALIGPGETSAKAAKNRLITYLSIPTSTTLTPTQTEADVSEARQIELNPTAAQPIIVRNNGTFDIPTANIKKPIVLVVDEPYRLSVTEPTGKGSDSYYPDNDAGAGGSGSAYDEGAASYAGYEKPFDKPLDKDRPNDIWNVVRKDHYYPHYRVIHLQRLANPLVHYESQRNPYVTIDTLAIDLITFNGIADDSAHADHSGGNLQYAVTRERGEWNEPANPTANLNNLWRHEPEDQTPQNDRGSVPASYRLKPHLAHSLGFLNYHLNRGGAGPQRLPRGPGQYLGDPQQPFPWLTWLNRPFVNQYELMLVPAYRPYELLHAYRTATIPPNTPNPYQPASPEQVPFPHLLNFFESTLTPRPSTSTRTSPLVYRLLDYVGVPSPYIYTEIQVPPAQVVTGTGHFFRPPFNRVPLYREPGRMNINTLAGPGVGEGLVSAFPGLWDMGLWDMFVASRKGSAPLSTNDPVLIQRAMLTCDPTQPSRFMRPFRAWFGNYLVPSSITEQEEVEATALRSVSASGVRRPLLENRSTQLCTHSDYNPYFRYQGYQKLGNLVTTRSNVYAVWITVGYFEVSWGGSPSAILPDGYVLGQELGLDRGEVRRHRAFYIIDRTIPVGFERGEDHNVEKTILLRRFIE